MRTLIHKKSKTPSEKILSKTSFTREEVLGLLNALHPASAEPVTRGITLAKPKAPVKPKAQVDGVNVIELDGIEYLQFNCPNGGKPFKFAGRKAYEIAEYFDALVDFAMVYAEAHGLPSPK